MILPLLGGSYLGWSLGANDASNVFGAAVASRMVRFRTAALLCSLFLILGALLQGQHGMHTLTGLTRQTALTAGLTATAAALTVTLMTLLKLPISTSQAVVGAIIGIGLMRGQINLAGLGKVVVCWVGTPIGAAVLAFLLYPLTAAILNRLHLGIYRQDRVLRGGLIAAGCYGSYALGANNVANVAAPLLDGGLESVQTAALVGAIAIAMGVLTFGRRVMDTVGKGIVRLDAYSALIVVLSQALTVHVFAVVGVPVSTSQAVIGAVLGVGLARGSRAIRFVAVRNVALGWLLTPAVACFLSVLLYVVAHLRYVG